MSTTTSANTPTEMKATNRRVSWHEETVFTTRPTKTTRNQKSSPRGKEERRKTGSLNREDSFEALWLQFVDDNPTLWLGLDENDPFKQRAKERYKDLLREKMNELSTKKQRQAEDTFKDASKRDKRDDDNEGSGGISAEHSKEGK